MDRRILGFPLIAAALAGCGPFGSTGSLQTGAFGYVCSSAATTTDLGCGSSFFVPSDVPGAIAVGAHFDLEYSHDISIFSDDSSPIVASLAPAAPSLLGAEAPVSAGATGFKFSAPGTVAVLARTADGSVVDFLHVKGVAFDHVALQDSLGQEVPATLSVPSSGTDLQAVPMGPSDQALAGGLAYTWTSSDEAVVRVVAGTGFGSSSGVDSVHLDPVGSGTATVSVQILDQQASVDVSVAAGGSP